jgi:hypothetical protein
MDSVLDRLWLARADELKLAATALAKADRLGARPRAALLARLNSLGAEIGLPAGWKLIELNSPDGSKHFRAAFPMLAKRLASPMFMLQDDFDGGLIDGMSESRYLARKICELADQMNEIAGQAPAIAGRIAASVGQ